MRISDWSSDVCSSDLSAQQASVKPDGVAAKAAPDVRSAPSAMIFAKTFILILHKNRNLHKRSCCHSRGWHVRSCGEGVKFRPIWTFPCLMCDGNRNSGPVEQRCSRTDALAGCGGGLDRKRT